MNEEQEPTAYKLQIQRAKENNDLSFIMKDIELRKWAVEMVMVNGNGFVTTTPERLYEFITGYEKAPEPMKMPEPQSDVYDPRN